MRISDWSSDVCSSDLIAGEYRGAEATTGDTPPVQAKVDPGIGRRGGSRYAERRRGIPVEAVHRIESDQALIVNICQRCDVAPAFRHRQCYARRDVELMLGRIGETAIAQIPERGIGIAVIFGVEISVFDRHIEPFDGRSDEHTSELQSLMR